MLKIKRVLVELSTIKDYVTPFLLVLTIFFMSFKPITAEDMYLYEAIATLNAPVYVSPNDISKVMTYLKTGSVVQVYGEIMCGEDKSPYKVIKCGNSYGYTPFFSIERTSSIYDNKVIASSDIKNPYDFVSLEGNLRRGAFKDLINSYVILPEYIRAKFQIEGYVLRMTEQDVQYESFGPQGYTEGTMFACFDCETKKLYINDENARHVVHEMGHFVNDRLGMFSSRSENKVIFDTEKDKLTMYAVTSPAEFYAECFDMYFRCNDLLKVQSPLAYDMIEQSLEEFKVVATVYYLLS